MNGAANRVVTPSGKQVAGVDDNGPLNGRGVDELPRGALYLETSSRVLE